MRSPVARGWRLVAGVALCLGPLQLPAQAPPPGLQASADSLLLDLHRRGWFQGAVVLGRSGKPLYARGFGYANLAAGIRFTPDTPTDAASVAKTLTAAAVLMLEEEGRLHLDDPVQRHVPEYPHPGTRICDLLTHSAGLPEAQYDFFDGLIPPGRIRTTALFLDILREKGVRPTFEPGTRFSYSSLGFDVAALLVERVTGRRWDDFLRDRVFDPLGMRATFLRPARLSDWSGVRTLGYRRLGDSLAVDDVFDNEGFYGGSNIYSSARDLYRWSRSFYTTPVLGEAALARGRRAAVLGDPATGKSGALGLNLLSWYYPRQGRRYHYPGALQGFWSSVYRDEEQGYSVVYVSNNGMPQFLRPLLTRALIDIVEGRRPAPIREPGYAALDAETLNAVAGTYRVDGVGTVALERRGRHALIRIQDGLDYPAFLLGDGQLYVPGLDVWIGFPADSAVRFRRLRWVSIFHVATGERTSLPSAAGP